MGSRDCVSCKPFAPSWAGKDVFAVITGTTRGLGSCLAQQLVKVMCAVEKTCPKSIHIFLIGRNIEKLEETKRAISSVQVSCPDKVNVIVDSLCVFDFSTATEQDMTNCLQMVAQKAAEAESSNELHLLFNNAATIGSVGTKADDLVQVSRLDNYCRTNFTSMVSFTSIYLRLIKPRESKDSVPRLVCVINISSLCGLVPFKEMSDYCSIKAARAMYMRCLATDRNDVAVLSYAPGPLKTDMLELVKKNLQDEDALNEFKEMELTDRVIDPSISAAECISWLGYLTTSDAKHGGLCHEHHRDILGMFMGSQLDFFDARDQPNQFRAN